MEIIEKVVDRIDEEIEDSTEYAMMAAEVKDFDPALSHLYYTLSLEEAKHQALLHDYVVKKIETYRAEHGEPPAPMMAMYKLHHKKSIKAMEKAKRYQEIYKQL